MCFILNNLIMNNIKNNLKSWNYEERKEAARKLEAEKKLEFFHKEKETTKQIWALLKEKTKYDLVKKFGEEVEMPDLKANNPENFNWFRYWNDLVVVYLWDDNWNELDVEKLYRKPKESFEELKKVVEKEIDKTWWY